MTDNAPSFGWALNFVDDLAAAVELYTRAFGLTLRFSDPSGNYAEFDTGATTLALCDRSLAAQSSGLDLTPDGAPRASITLVYADVPSAYARAVAAGARAVHEPATKAWGQVSSYVLDTDGNLIELASTIDG